MTGTVDIQKLKDKALMHKGWRDAMLVDPDTILALIEVAEAAKVVHRETMAREYADRELLVSALGALGSALTALEGVKK